MSNGLLLLALLLQYKILTVTGPIVEVQNILFYLSNEYFV